MARKAQREAVLSVLRQSRVPLSIAEIVLHTSPALPRRTVRRWLSEWVDKELIARSGVGRATRYGLVASGKDPEPAQVSMRFWRGLDDDLARQLLAQIRDLWTHTSTALEGNTLSLGDTHFVLHEGLTIAGKPIKDHQEVLGHAHAIDLVYQCLNEPLTESIVFDLHKAVQTEKVIDINKPIGAWKVEPNATHAIALDGRQAFIEYAPPSSVPTLMSEIIEYTNGISTVEVSERTAHSYYSKIHMGIVHVHPFWDGNGRIARLLANIPLLKAGLPPLTIPEEQRRRYIQMLADYQLKVGQLGDDTGVWPDDSLLAEFEQFSESCYDAIRNLVTSAFDVQKRRAIA